jgi:dTDP-4-dehydrorhamnose reductase
MNEKLTPPKVKLAAPQVLIFGAGFLGCRLEKELPGAFLSRVDITKRTAVEHQLWEIRPVAVINAAGKTGRPNVDWCEDHAFETFESNTMGPLILAQECAKMGAYLLHLGSGCIFYDSPPMAMGMGWKNVGWSESDFANPISTYSKSKYAADLMLSQMPNVGIARLRMPIDSIPGPRNLITKLAAYQKIIDVENSVTIVEDLIQIIQAMITQRATGVFHATNPGTMRHTNLLDLYREFVDPNHQYKLIGEKELVLQGLALKARSNCILSNSRLKELEVNIRPIDVALTAVMKNYAINCKTS